MSYAGMAIGWWKQEKNNLIVLVCLDIANNIYDIDYVE